MEATEITFSDIYNNGLQCYINSLDVTIDLDAGFFGLIGIFCQKRLN